MNWLKFFWSWDGRIGRRQFLGGLFAAHLAATLVMLVVVLSLGTPTSGGGYALTGWLFLLVFVPYVAIAPLQASLAVRRAHDLGISGYLLILLLALYAVAITVMAIWPALDGTWVEFVLAAPLLLSFVWLFLAPGEVHENRFGAPPSVRRR